MSDLNDIINKMKALSREEKNCLEKIILKI